MAKRNEYSNYGFSGDYVILMEKQTFTRTESGKNWKSKPDEVIRKVFTPKQYNNFLSFVPLFNDRVEKSYTMAGYHPVKVTSTCPDGSKKAVARFEFIYRPYMEDSAGWREKEVIKNAETYEIEYQSQRITNPDSFLYGGAVRHKYITLINPEESGVTHSATYDEYHHKWVN